MQIKATITQVVEETNRNLKRQKYAFAMYDGRNTYVDLSQWRYRVHIGEPLIFEVGNNYKGVTLKPVAHDYERQDGSRNHNLEKAFEMLPDGEYVLAVIKNAWQNYYMLYPNDAKHDVDDAIRVDMYILKAGHHNMQNGDIIVKNGLRAKNMSAISREEVIELKVRQEQESLRQARANYIRNNIIGKRFYTSVAVITDYGDNDKDEWYVDKYYLKFVMKAVGYNENYIFFAANDKLYAMLAWNFGGDKLVNINIKETTEEIFVPTGISEETSDFYAGYILSNNGFEYHEQVIAINLDNV